MTNQKQRVHPPISGKCESFCTRLSAALMAENFGDYESALAHWKEAYDFAGSSANKHMCKLRYTTCRLMVNGAKNSKGKELEASMCQLVIEHRVQITLKPNTPAVFTEIVELAE
ncbi:TPA: hypothetical protein ACVU5T_002102 [Vibrio parahaemolyticus]|nr:hypothetical protein [Vibrio parahaemolyticus]